MVTKQQFATITLVVLALTFAVAAAPLVTNLASALGVPHEKNFGQCSQDKNRNACQNNKDSFTGPNN